MIFSDSKLNFSSSYKKILHNTAREKSFEISILKTKCDTKNKQTTKIIINACSHANSKRIKISAMLKNRDVCKNTYEKDRVQVRINFTSKSLEKHRGTIVVARSLIFHAFARCRVIPARARRLNKKKGRTIRVVLHSIVVLCRTYNAIHARFDVAKENLFISHLNNACYFNNILYRHTYYYYYY